MASGIVRLLGGIRDLLYPPRCASCGELLRWRVPSAEKLAKEALCADCLLQWEEETETRCGICSRPVRCCVCMTELLDRAKCRALFKLAYYVPHSDTCVQNRLVYHMKRNNDSKTPGFLAAQAVLSISRVLDAEGILAKDCVITYVPRSRHAYLTHGTDQAKALARQLGDVLEIGTESLIGRNTKSNKAQKTLTPAEREKNAREAFFPLKEKDACSGKTVILVDDVVTTGASMARCVRLLRGMGAMRVYCFCVTSDRVNRDKGVRVDL